MKKSRALIILAIAAMLLISLSVCTAAALQEGDFTYILLSEDTVEITGYIGSSSEVIVPETIDGKKVTSIGDDAFRDNSDIKSVILPDTVTHIGKSAFASCSYLESVELSQGLLEIGASAFDMCSIKTLHIPATVSSIGSNAFYYTAMSGITVDEENLSYSSDERGVLFNKDKTVLIKYPCGNTEKKYVIPATVNDIEMAAFLFARHIEEVILPGTVREIKGECFSECESLKAITLPDSVEIIHTNAFVGSGIESIVFGAGLKEIEHDAFNISLDSVAYNGTKGQWERVNVAYSNKFYIGEDIKFKECVDHSFTRYHSNGDATYMADGTKTAWCDHLCGAKNTVIDEGTRKPLGTPVKVSHTPQNKAVTLTWDAVEGAGGYRVFVKNEQSGKWDIAVRTTGKKTTTAVKALKDGTKYTFAVRAYVNTGTEIIWAPKYTSVKTLTLPGTTAKLSFTSDSSRINLSWSKVEGATGYRVFLRNSQTGKWASIKTTGELSYVVSRLDKAQRYTFAVRAYTKYAGNYYWASSYITLKAATAPDTVTKLSKGSSRAESVSLSWNKSQGATGYRVFLWNTETKKWDIALRATSKSTATISGLIPGSRYIFAVRPYINTGTHIVWSATYTKTNVSTGNMNDQYARKLLEEASLINFKWTCWHYMTQETAQNNPEDVKYYHIIDPEDAIVATLDDGSSFYAYRVIDEISSAAELKKEIGKYFDSGKTEVLASWYLDYENKLYSIAADSGDWEPCSYYTDRIIKISDTHYRYVITGEDFYSIGDSEDISVEYDIIMVNGRWVFTEKYEETHSDRIYGFLPIYEVSERVR